MSTLSGSRRNHFIRQRQLPQSKHSKHFFSNFGLPDEIVSDNGPQFTAQQFQEFCKCNGIKHSRTPPYHPASNGAAERAVQVVKSAMKKMRSPTLLSRKLAEFLLIYRSTPHAATGLRPDELFLRRRLKTRLSLISPNLTPTIEKQQDKQKAPHDGKRPLVTFSKGEKVLVCNKRGNTKWVSGTVIRQKSPVTYLVMVGDKIRFCHADHLLQQPRAIVSTQLPAETDFDAIDVWPDIIETPSEELSGESEVGEPGVTNAPLPNYRETIRRSTREIRAPQRLIEEL